MKLFRICIFSLIFMSCFSESRLNKSQTKKFHQQFIDGKEFIEDAQWAIRNTPITNREYLIYVCWSYNVYGTVTPEKVLSILPNKGVDFNGNLDQYLIQLISDPQSFPSNYIFNHHYLDYPLMGLSSNQVLEMMQWMTDRYNENIMVKTGRYNFLPTQFGSECFTTETYLSDIYTGSVRSSANPITWADKLFLPGFRLPVDQEVLTLPDELATIMELKSFSFKVNHFLYDWNEYYLGASSKKYTVVNLKRNEDELIELQDEELEINQKIETVSIKNLDSIYRNVRYFNDQVVKSKDEYGRIDFVIIGKTNEERLLVANPVLLKTDQPTEGKIFWVYFNMEFSYKK